jgi:hypothetical protein
MRLDWPSLPTLTPLSVDSIGVLAKAMTTGGLSSNTVTQNTRYYYPFVIYKPCIVTKVFAVTGATQNGNIDIAIYDSQKNLIQASGSNAQGAANTLQVIDWTDLILLPGEYWMSIASDSATGTFFMFTSADEIQQPVFNGYTQASAFTAPDPAAMVTSTMPVILFGLLIDDTVLS